MNRDLAETVVKCLGLSGETYDIGQLGRFKVRDWQRTVRWLDRSGLTLYLLRRLQSVGTTDLLPPSILARFEGNITQNRRRLDYIANEFALVNERFRRAGVNFAVIKGFSLVPAFCPDALLRAVSDLDYLVDKQSLPAAQRVLAEAGYCTGHFFDIEFKFSRPSSRIPTLSDDPYSRETEPLIELHVAFWNRANRVVLNEPEFRLDQTVSHDWQGLRFPVLKEEDAFVLQVLHVFQHTLEGWIKLCWLLEIGYFLRARSLDSQFWDRVDVRMREVPRLIEFAAVVMGLAERIVAAPMPPMAANWKQTLPSVARSWIESYGRKWAIEDHPFDIHSLFSATKLSLFLHREFASDAQGQKEITRRRLFPWKRPVQIAVTSEKTAVSFLLARRLQLQFVMQRLVFHLGSDLRYFWEMPRWRELIRPAAGIPRGGLHKYHN